MIKALKIGNLIREDIKAKIVSEDGTVEWNVPQDLDKFKALALDTFSYQAGQSVLSVLGTHVGLSTMVTKYLAVLTKLQTPTKGKLDSLTDNEKAAFDSMSGLAEGGYGDSEKLVSGLHAVTGAISKATGKSMRVMQATTHEAVIAVLNEE